MLKHVGKLLAKQLPLVLPRGSYVRRTSRPIPSMGASVARAASARGRSKPNQAGTRSLRTVFMIDYRLHNSTYAPFVLPTLQPFMVWY